MKYKIKKVDAIDYKDTIINLWQKNFASPAKDAEKRFTWMYENNLEGVPDVWFVFNEVEVCGMIAVGKRKFYHNNRVINAGQTMDFVVDKRHRSLGPAIKLQRCVINHMNDLGVDFIYSFPNQNSKAVIKRAGFTDYCRLNRWTLILRSDYLIKRYITNIFFVAAASCITNIFLSLKQKIKSKNFSQFDSYFLNSVDNEVDFDALWHFSNNSYRLVGDRSISFLHWRFTKFPEENYKYFLVKKKTNDEAFGYIVFQISDGHIFIVDYYSGLVKNMESLFQLFIKAVVKKKCMSISIESNDFPLNDETMLLMGFIKRPCDDSLVVAVRDDLQGTLMPDQWYITVADRDV